VRLVAAALAVAAIPAAASGCGGDQSNGGKVKGDTLTIFSSLPLQGRETERAKSILRAEKLALKQAGGKAGNFKVNFSFLSDAAPNNGKPGWNPDQVADNARKAVEDLRTIAYVGDLESGASAVSIPITNEAGFAQISPGSTSVGLTKRVPGAEKGEPDKYYPSGERNFVRVVPGDDVEASGAAEWARKLGARTAFVLGDRSVEGDGLAELFRVTASGQGLRIVGEDRIDPRAKDYRDIADEVAKARPDAVFFGGGVDSNAAALWEALGRAVPNARLIGTHELLAPAFYGGLGDVERQTYLTSVAQDPFAAYGYTAMSLLLDAIKRAGGAGGDRERVIRELFDTNDYAGVVGTFSIDDNGDTSLDRIAGYRVAGGRPVFAASLRGTPSE
jgi:branched-chain amino acid transport system substrate-binding protein